MPPPTVPNISPFGNIPYLLSLASGFILMLLVILIFIKIDKARHLVFYEFDSVDPFFTTYLIFIFGFLCSSIFVYELKTDPQFDQNDKNKIEASIPRSIYLGNILLSILPSSYWLAILFYNNPFSHIYSIAISVMMIFYLSTIYLNMDYKFRKIADPQSKFSIAINKAHFHAINKFLLIIISIIFIYFLFKYEIALPKFIENIKTKLTFNSSINNHVLYIAGTPARNSSPRTLTTGTGVRRNPRRRTMPVTIEHHVATDEHAVGGEVRQGEVHQAQGSTMKSVKSATCNIVQHKTGRTVQLKGPTFAGPSHLVHLLPTRDSAC